MTGPAPAPARDLPAIAAFAAANGYDNEPGVASTAWRLAPTDERVNWRRIAGAAVAAASLQTTPPAALNPATPPDALALAETYWAVHQTVAPELRGGPLPLEKLGPRRVEATKAGVLAVVAEALPSVGILDDALRKACAERETLREGLKNELAEREALLEELLKNTGDEGGGFDSPEDIAVRYVRHLEAEVERLKAGPRWIEKLGPVVACEHEATQAEARHTAEDDGVSVDIGSPEDGDYDRCEPTL